MRKSFVPLKITARLRCRDGRELEVSAGDVLSQKGVRFVEFHAIEARKKAQIQWSNSSDCCGPEVGDRELSITLDEERPVPVILRSGRLYRASGRKITSEQYSPKELAWLGDHLVNLQFDTAGLFVPGKDRSAPTVMADAVGCVADYAGAGAGIGAAGGVVLGGELGGPPGAGAGAGVGGALGGAAGAALGLGFCVVGPALEELFDWLF